MDEQRINFLSEKLLKGEGSMEEIQEFDAWYTSLDDQELNITSDRSKKELGLRIFSVIDSRANLSGVKTERIKAWPLIAAAAAIVILFSVGIFYRSQLTTDKKSAYVKEFPSGKSGATLTLSNGKRILLTAAATGVLAKEAGVVIRKTKDGKLIYLIADRQSPTGHTPDNNRLSTSRGQTYQVRLPDGSLVWLNAASTIVYPSSFSGSKERSLTLIGEAYFEIAKDQKHPFVVKTAKQSVTVLGTHFNISSYPEDPATNTTLIEGSVELSRSYDQRSSAAHKESAVVLKPGQLATLTGESLKVKVANVEVETAWKNGEFRFRNDRLENVMRKISRWYNLEIAYRNPALKDERFGGTISKFGNVADVLHMLELTGAVHFAIQGRRIIVY